MEICASEENSKRCCKSKGLLFKFKHIRKYKVNWETGIGGEEREREVDDAGCHAGSALLTGSFSRPFYTEGRQLVDDLDSRIRNGRI